MRIKEIDGLPVIDAKEPLTLHVSKRDVAYAEVKEPNACAVARACRRELAVKEARIHLGRVYLRNNESNWVRYLTPKSMRDEIIAFDRGGAFEPGEFILAPPHPTKQLGKSTGGRKPRRNNAKPRKPPHIIKNVRGGPA